MVYRQPHAIPRSQISEDRQGRTVGQFCKVCGTIYPLHRGRHTGKPMYGRDHIASPCAHEGDLFVPGADWWEPAVEVLPEAVQQPPGTTLVTGSPLKGTEP
ncbi:MAG TPA: hypothetical protein VHU81_20775 [Thermoanaerobaculia bacterium]|jgi:hypothetical protein|nr:hypothetical protein [Thermoanaerobaculia bacterium]